MGRIAWMAWLARCSLCRLYDAGLGKGPAYERWAKVYNLKQMAAALQYLQEHHLTDYAALTARTEAAVDHFHKLSDELRTTEETLSKTSELMASCTWRV